MEKSYNPLLVLLSIVVAITGAYVAIEIAQRVRETVGSRRTFWLGGGAVAMALGIWSMHFVAMLALRMGEPVWYDASVTGLSMFAAFAGCAIAFAIFDRATLKSGVIPLASVIMGIAIAGMHYTGMAAMRMSASVQYDAGLVAASVGVAIVVSYAALIITRRVIVSSSTFSRRIVRTGAASVLLGMAIVGMHYTGMAAVHFTPGPGTLAHENGYLLGDRNLGVIVGITSLMLLIVAFISTQFERWRIQAASRWRSLLEISPQIVWSANARGEMIDANQYWYDYTGLERGGAVGTAWADALHSGDRERVLAAWHDAIQAGSNFETEFRIRGADGDYHSFISKARPVRNDRGEIIRWMGIAIDIEDRKIAEQELEIAAMELGAQTEALQATTDELMRKTAEAEAANQAKSEFLASVSHELRTPLNAIGGYADLLEMELRGPLTPAQREDIARIKRSQQHLLGLINDVLNFAKLEAGQIKYRVEEVALERTVRDTEAMIAPQISAKELRYHFEECEHSVVALADREKVQQILLNLLSNAVKFTERKGSITVSCGVSGDRAILRVADTGTGIPPDKLGRIFEPFVQVDQRLSQMSQGVGLGLSISRDLARAMGGELRVESTLGEGSTFILELPGSGSGTGIDKRKDER